MKNFHLVVIISFAVSLLVCSGNVFGQRYSYNKWDGILFKNKPTFSQRLFSLTELNLGYGARYLDQPYEISRGGISTMLGYRYKRAISVGIGTGLEAYNGGALAPLYLEGHIYMNSVSQGSVKPFLTGASGLLFNLSGIKTGINVFANPGFGFIIPMTYRSSLSISVGLHTQWDTGEQRYSFINAKMGLLFF